ncbi:glycosyl hydrolase family 47 domain-containing protein [Sarocladium implicatum]|nr:glycosyl hydrolase family 47 domain-containing protein [Sarocladium implicatum]
MFNHMKGRFRRRYVAILVFFLVTLLLWKNHNDAIAGNTALGTLPPSGGIHYVPSSYDWSRARIFYPVKEVMAPPRGSLKNFPRIQSRGNSKLDDSTRSRRDAIRNAFIKSWNAYKSKAWGHDELAPLSETGKKSLSGWGAQLIDALDTLWIMDLKDEFRLAVRQVATIDWAATNDHINVFEVTIRHLGGLISAYELSGEQVLLYKAVELGDMLYAAFDTPNRLPPHWLDVYKARSGRQEADESMSGAAGGSLCLEFTRLTQLTGDPKYYDATERLKQFFHKFQNETTIPGLWPHTMNYQQEKMTKTLYTLGAGSDSMYEYLPKMHALLGGLDLEYEKMIVKALEAARDNLMYKPMNPSDKNFLMIGKATVNKNKIVELAPETEHLACFAGGMYALAGRLLNRGHFTDLGARLTRGCVWAYESFQTNIMPEIVELVACESRYKPCPYDPEALPSGRAKNLPAGFVRVRDTEYRLRPEAIESVFYMWRTTGEKTYREAAWSMWKGIVRETETDLAFATVDDTFWMGETLKYFYLIFSEHHVLSLDDWVFNTEAHPFKRPGR